jgi:hypothetical protein
MNASGPDAAFDPRPHRVQIDPGGRQRLPVQGMDQIARLAEPGKADDLTLCAAMSPRQPSFVPARQHTWSEPFHGVCLAIAVTYRSSVEICPVLLGISIDAWS